MQPNFTLKKLGFVCSRIFALAMIVGLTTQISFSQEKRQHFPKETSQQQAERERQKLERSHAPATSRVENSFGIAPLPSGANQNLTNLTNVVNPLSRAVIYDVSAGAWQLQKHSLSNTTVTNVGSTVTFGFAGAEAWNTQNDKLYVVDQAAPFGLYTVDTITGVRTFVVNCTGVPHANLTGMTWDPFTNTMYGVSSDLSVSQIFTINITTGVCTPIGTATATVPGAIMINAAPGGSLFSVDIVNDNLYKWNKTTGTATLVGSLGINTNFGQDGHFDFSDGQYYWATINAGAANAREFRVIDTSTGASTLLGNYTTTGQIGTMAIFSVPLIPCSGTPNPGNTVSSAPSACPGTNFTLSLQNLITTSGNTYQWQSAPASTGPWTNIAGATNQTLVRNHTVATYYRCVVTCTNGPATANSNPVLVGLTPPSGCYCTPPASNCTDNDEIIRVQISTLDNASGCSPGPPAGYADYTNSVAAPDLQAGIGNTITVSYKTLWSKSGAVWIDYNHNGQFEASEYTSTGSGTAAVAQLIASINIPGSALPGPTRMRVRTTFGTGGFTPTGACTSVVFGETEDYTVNILPCVPVTITTSPTNKTIQCSGSTTFTVATTGTVASYQWEYRTSATGVWQFVTNGGIYSGASTATLTLDNVSQAFNGYQYRAVLTGGCSATDFSGVATLTVGPLIATVTPTSATICTGSIQKLTLTNASSPTTVTFTNNTPLPVPDATPAGVYSTIPVSGIPAGAIITNVSVRVNISHTWVGDMENNLIAPNGVSMNLIGELDGGTGSNSSDDFINTVISSTSTTPLSGAPAPRTGTFGADRLQGYGPSGNFQTLPNGMAWSNLLTQMNGNWRLGLSDWFTGDVGTLNSWSITITYGAPAAGVWTASPATPNTMFTDAAATVPYVAGSLATEIWVKPTVTTNYSVVYTTATPCVSPPTVIPVNVVNPVTNIAAPTDKSVCIGGTTSFSSATATGGPFTRQWQVSADNGLTWTNVAGASTSATLTLTGVTQLMNNYLYRCAYTAAPCVGTVYSGVAKLTVNSLPVVAITAPDLALTPPQTTVITATSTPAAAANGWAWTLNGAAISGTGNTQTVNIDKIGTYQATVTDINGCVSKSNLLVIGSEASDRLWIYPNPTTGQFQVRLYYDSDVTERRRVSIYNMLGQAVTSRQFTLADNYPPYLRMDFDLTNFQRGIYLVKVVNEFSGQIVSGFVLLQ